MYRAASVALTAFVAVPLFLTGRARGQEIDSRLRPGPPSRLDRIHVGSGR